MTDPGHGRGVLWRRKPSPRLALELLIGVALLVAAIWLVASSGEALSSAVSHLRRVSPLLALAALALPLANWLIISGSFCLLNGLYAKVRFDEMSALIASAWLLNYLPLRPGLLGRVAWHRKFHGISVAQSIRVLVISMAMTAAWAGALLGAAVLLGSAGVALWAPALAAPAALLALAGAGARAAGRDAGAAIRFAALLRYLDMLVWIARYGVVFAMVGRPLSLGEAAALAVVSQIALSIPIAGNGLGVREWAIGLTAAALPAFALKDQADGVHDAAAVAIAADLLHRGVELVALVPVGLLASGWLARRARRHVR